MQILGNKYLLIDKPSRSIRFYTRLHTKRSTTKKLKNKNKQIPLMVRIISKHSTYQQALKCLCKIMRKCCFFFPSVILNWKYWKRAEETSRKKRRKRIYYNKIYISGVHTECTKEQKKNTFSQVKGRVLWLRRIQNNIFFLIQRP